MRNDNISWDRVWNIDETAVQLELFAQRLWQPTRQRVDAEINPAAMERVIVTVAASPVDATVFAQCCFIKPSLKIQLVGLVKSAIADLKVHSPLAGWTHHYKQDEKEKEVHLQRADLLQGMGALFDKKEFAKDLDA
eukprot:2278237-Amphidinium_carterae.1